MKTQIAQTILDQLGGGRFIIMVGARNIMATNDGLIMSLRRNKIGASHLQISLLSNDTYKMEFIVVRNFERKTKKEITGLYCDQLIPIFERETGYYTSL